jgi:phenylacetate-CoA ligase
MTLHIETTAPEAEDAAIVESIQAVTKLRGGVARVAAGSLPSDGRLIEDRRPIG